MKGYLIHIRLLLCLMAMHCILAATSTARAQVTVDVAIDSLELLVGQQTRISLQVSANVTDSVQLPQYQPGDTLTAGVEVVKTRPVVRELLNEDKRVLLTADYIITSFDSALYYLPPMQVKVNGANYASNSLALRVLSIPVDTLHTDVFFPIDDIMAPQFTWDDWKYVFWSALLAALLVGLSLYLYIALRDNRPIVRIIRLAPPVPPHTQAMQEIDSIKAEKVWQAEDSKQYYTRLTATLRTYIQRRFGFNAMEMTSAQIIEHLTAMNDKESINELTQLFETADLVKFAKYNTLINENDRNLVCAIEFINHTKEEEDKTAKPNNTQVVVEHKRSAKVLWTARIALCLFALTALALLVWGVREVYWLVA